jgi:single-strand DNA-binding protein
METSMYSINRVVLVGRLTRDPELRALPSGASVCELRIACNSSRKDPDTGERSERPNYFDVKVYGAPGESVATYMSRGRLVAVDGRLAWREWEQDEQKRQAVSIVADSVQFLDGPGERDASDPGAGEVGELVGAVAGADGLAF